MYRRIVAALDGSASSKNALHQALKLAQLTHGRIHAIIEETQSPADDVPLCLTRCVQRQSRTLRPLHTRRRRSAKWRTAGAPISCFATTAPLHISHRLPPAMCCLFRQMNRVGSMSRHAASSLQATAARAHFAL